MKITCQSCQAKYTIADEKVAGKTVKIKCKKCGAAIVVHGNELVAQPAPAAASSPPRPAAGGADDDAETRVFGGAASHSAAAAGADEWTVNVSDDEQRPMSTAQVVEEFRKGVLTADSYVWKDGMPDWLPLGSVPEFASLRSSAPPAAAAANPFAGVTSPLAAAPAGASQSPAAARRQGGRSAGVDLFGSPKEEPPPAMPAPMHADRLVGERNENSVLFSLAALTAAETAAKVQKRDDVVGFGGKNNGRGGFDDIMNLGGGGLSGSPILAPPPLLAPVVEERPPPAPMMAAAQMQPFIIPAPPPKKSPAALVLGVLLGMTVMGIVAFFAFGNPTPPPPLTPESTTPTTQPTPTAATTAPVATTTEPAATAPTAAATTDKDKPKDKPTSAGGPGPVARPVDKPDKPTDKPADKPTAEAPPPEKPKEPEPPSGGGKEFSKAAASAALNAAAGAARGCKKADGPTGTAKVSVTFAPSGNVTSASVQGGPFAGTSVGGCIASAFRSAKIPAFDGSPVRTSKSVIIN